jgi:hypothetical protein
VAALWYSGIGGAVMLTLAVLAHSAASASLAVIGALWLGMALIGRGRYRRLAQDIIVSGDSVIFTAPGRVVTVPVVDVVEIRRPWNRQADLQVRTGSAGTVRVAGHLNGLVVVAAELVRLNPEIRLVGL